MTGVKAEDLRKRAGLSFLKQQIFGLAGNKLNKLI